jgi:hypothetical protein
MSRSYILPLPPSATMAYSGTALALAFRHTLIIRTLVVPLSKHWGNEFSVPLGAYAFVRVFLSSALLSECSGLR